MVARFKKKTLKIQFGKAFHKLVSGLRKLHAGIDMTEQNNSR